MIEFLDNFPPTLGALNLCCRSDLLPNRPQERGHFSRNGGDRDDLRLACRD